MGSAENPSGNSAMAEHYSYLSERVGMFDSPQEKADREQQNQQIELAHQAALERAKQPPNGLFEDFARSVGHSAIQTPLNAVTQLIDKTTGTELLPKVQIGMLEAPAAAQFGTANYWAQQSGSAIGMIAPFLLAGKGVKTFTRAGMTETQLAANLSSRTILGLSTKEAVLTGAVHDSLLRPVDQNSTQPFLVGKALNGANGAMTMFALSTIGRQFTPAAGVSTSRFLSLVKNPYTGGMVSGLGAGAVSAQGHEYLSNLKFDSASSFARSATTDAKFASLKETAETAFTMGVIGVGFGAYHKAKGQFESPRKNFEWSNKSDTADGAAPKEFKVIGGEKAVTAALEQVAKTGEVLVNVREHLGRPAGISRFLGVQEYGPPKSLLIKHNETRAPIIPEGAKTADLVATCYLDPAMAHKSVLGAQSISAGEPIFMKAGRNRLSFSPTEQSAKPGDNAPHRLGLGEGYNVRKVAIREGQEWTQAEKAKLQEGEWTKEMVAKLPSVSDYLKGEGELSLREDVLSISRLKGMKVSQELGRGNDALVLEMPPQPGLPEGGALKLAHNYEGGWNDTWGTRPFDAKILMGGKPLEPTNGSNSIIYVQELVTPNYDASLNAAFHAKLNRAGEAILDPGGAGGFQYGMSLKSGKVVLVDYQATEPNEVVQALTDPTYLDRENGGGREGSYSNNGGAERSSNGGGEKIQVLKASDIGTSETMFKGQAPWKQEVWNRLQQGDSIDDAALSRTIVLFTEQPNANWDTLHKQAVQETKKLKKEGQSKLPKDFGKPEYESLEDQPAY